MLMLKNREKGFTLVELMFSTLIFPMLFMALYLVLETSNVIFQTNDVYSRLNTSAMQALRFIGREVGQTSPNIAPSHLNVTTAGGNSIVRFQIPVDWDNDGDADTGGLNPQTEWGVYDRANELQNGRLNGWARYSVDNQNRLIREVLDSGLSSISDLQTVVANNVQNFTATQSADTLTMTLTLQGANQIGQKGQARQIQSTMTLRALLRNAVS